MKGKTLPPISGNAFINYLVRDGLGTELVGLRIRNAENVQDKVVGISLRRRDQFKPDVACGVLGKVIQRNGRFGLDGRLEIHLGHACWKR